ncbi:glycosyltransferase family 2 protein [Paucibacter sp. DJ1R-11]|uniref:glycosyltransferase family 2 protein n=1 Tax=Paucibacter sp. DJ1R-11 TaxID=2893556 RepID=UPI0021E45191|nr:glycosyltransferase family 2 protein [Paucibacter sp. DJ1R-11]MCV2364702.1 glycosyltransferase family 2 protein [Paucibacter sp. DJ1R-11]
MTPIAPTLPFIGIVTVLFNSDDLLDDFFKSLASQTFKNFRLYVLDNSASDSGSEIARRLALQHGIVAKVVFNNANLGVAKGNNQGIALALADGCSHVLLANNDTEFGSQTLAELIGALDGKSELAATAKIMYHDAPETLWYGGGRITPWTLLTPHYGIDTIDRGQFDQQEHVGYAPTCFMLIDASVFSSVGMMDEQYFVYYDDTDFIWRMGRQGIRIRFVASAVVLHKVSSSTGGGHSPFSVYYTNRNRVYFIRKNLQGLRRMVALGYFLLTRIPRLGTLAPSLARRGWRGLADGFRMVPPPLR